MRTQTISNVFSLLARGGFLFYFVVFSYMTASKVFLDYD